jgi:hypothetical protein
MLASRIHLDIHGIFSSPARMICLALGLVMAPLSGGFYQQSDLATALWPWPDDRMSFIFLSSIGMAVSATCLFAALTGEIGGLTPILLEGVITLIGMAGYLAVRSIRHEDWKALWFAIGLGTIATIVAISFRRARKVPLLDPRVLPRLLRIISGGLVALLAVIGASLVFQVDGAFPWTLKPQTSTMFGWIFLGAAALFGWIVLHPRWAHLATAMVGFLAYDLVLVIPYARTLLDSHNGTASSFYPSAYGLTGNIDEGKILGYLLTLGLSAAGSIYLLAKNLKTRMRGRASLGF